VAAAAARKTNAAGGRELQMALKLVEEMSEKWNPKAFTDTYRDDLMKRIEQKVKSRQTHTLTAPEADVEERATTGGKVVDLMSLLQRSLEQKGTSSGNSTARGSKRKHVAARRRTTHPRAARRA
jgi:DNA end-binding protein Ku